MPTTGPSLAFLILILGAVVPGLPSHADGIPASRPASRLPTDRVGQADWEKGEDLLKRIPIPPAPVRSAEEERATFRVDPAYRVELVASEPMIRNPVTFEFDSEGRIWVVEYSGYMRDPAGSGESDPICRVLVLEDSDGDGRADRSTVFLDHLSLPRSLAFVRGGVLIQEPPHLWFCEDTDGDLRCDRKRGVGTLGVAGDPQNSANGLRPGLDNWLHNAFGTRQFQWRDGELVGTETLPRGQFGVDFDDTGRLLTCSGSQPLLGDLIPAEYAVRNPHLREFAFADGNPGVTRNLAAGAGEIYPIRPTPGVRLGARELREDGRLRTYTAACGLCYYDGNQFPPDAQRNVFVPEPAGNLVGRLVLGDGVAPTAKRFYPEEREFLASTDERFRPVCARVGPDGALYVADLYHGILEHTISMVPWLTRQIAERKLDQGNDLGRLWRVVATGRPIHRDTPHLGTATPAELVATLSHPNGWHRRTAQRLLVERASAGALPLLRAQVRPSDPITALHSLWTLEGLAALDAASLQAALESPDDRVRAAGIRLCEREGGGGSLQLVSKYAMDPSPRVRLQVALTAGTFRDPAVFPVLRRVLSQNDGPEFRMAVLSGLEGLELEFLTDWMLRPESRAGDPETITLLARCVLEEGQPGRISDLFRVLLNTSDEHPVPRQALLEALAGFERPVPFALEDEPRGLTTLLTHPDPETRVTATRAATHFTWPGAPRSRP
ncbi:MAG: HEAT repeat domain-containing protein [Verrucomicrobiales bacterium]|nr:HEAT repeat domain-containing protein [Verrucomicrobiales bacterium]